ncbi:unnamed protein product [Bursaphelenchus okinawaensis]|uniref:Uncharacterized protein n=1 Tax=Bursaphelenchus okinawaensis TaxID=465554 RepID=A0A811K986_9BILA|nr:unnamed protein product [Bursaphelenchus okinawaensis]CAG9096881.1 unnamed protein product [Bursaphelenchus okinawaensis]
MKQDSLSTTSQKLLHSNSQTSTDHRSVVPSKVPSLPQQDFYNYFKQTATELPSRPVSQLSGSTFIDGISLHTTDFPVERPNTNAQTRKV